MQIMGKPVYCQCLKMDILIRFINIHNFVYYSSAECKKHEGVPAHYKK